MTTWLKQTQKLLKQNDRAKAKKFLAGQGLVLLPCLIDAHVHFRTPGSEPKENWRTASRAMVKGGVPAVIDMPNNVPSIVDRKTLNEKIKLINRQLGFPVKYFLYLGATTAKLPDKNLKNKVVGLKVYVGSSTGNLLVDKADQLEKIFKTWPGLLSFHAEDEELIKIREKKFSRLQGAEKHSKVRNDEVAARAVKKIIALAQKYNRRVYICHVSTAKEIELIKKAKKQGVKIYAEATPHHLFLTAKDYKKWKNFIRVNPPVRSQADCRALWRAVTDGTIDVLATDHAPHLPKEKKQAYAKAPSGIPEIDTFLPLMLDAVNHKKITLAKLIELTHTNPIKIFKLKGLEKYGTIVDLKLAKKVLKKNLKTKCGWTPYEGKNLTGWPVATILNNKIYKINN